jgi:Zinc finger, C3HC4 type (RING finger)
LNFYPVPLSSRLKRLFPLCQKKFLYLLRLQDCPHLTCGLGLKVRSKSTVEVVTSEFVPTGYERSHGISNVPRESNHDLSQTRPVSKLYCRVPECTRNPCNVLTTTICGHLFCYECIAQRVAETSRCPVCNSMLLLYCLFKIDLDS